MFNCYSTFLPGKMLFEKLRACHCCDLSSGANCQSSNYADVLNVRSALGLSITFANEAQSDGSLFNQIGL